MAIEETRKKIHFVPFEIKKGRAIDTRDAPTVTIVEGSLRFSKPLIVETALNGKFVSFAYDPIKNVVGWKVKPEVSLAAVGKNWKLVRANGKSGMWTVSIKKMLDLINQKASEKKYYRLPVQKYVEANGMDRGQIYYFVELVDEIESEGETAQV